MIRAIPRVNNIPAGTTNSRLANHSSIVCDSTTTPYLSPAVPAFEDDTFSQQSFLALDGSGRREEPSGGWNATHIISKINFSLRRKPE